MPGGYEIFGRTSTSITIIYGYLQGDAKKCIHKTLHQQESNILYWQPQNIFKALCIFWFTPKEGMKDAKAKILLLVM